MAEAVDADDAPILVAWWSATSSRDGRSLCDFLFFHALHPLWSLSVSGTVSR